MEIEFEKDYLRELYKNGKTKSKKHRFQKNIIKRYIKTIDKLRAASNTTDLHPLRSLKYEKLKGNKKGLESVRVSNKYRIEFISRTKDKITICSILELSNHYS